ncbi:class B sortase [Christensenella minuta]|uniref:class B sortase n=1 Tax=Christensenella minuta TaxID=626937 RepID=UPI0021573938|nr:class B sortase [Christensenella minuta]
MAQKSSRQYRYYTEANCIRKRETNSNRFLSFLRATMVLCAIAITVFAVLLINNNREYSQGDAVYGEIRSLLHNEDAEPENTDVAISASLGRSTQMDFASLRAVNEDVVGWILAEGRSVDYPVVHGEDNEYYLTHLFDHKKNKLGTLFVDYRNHGDFSDKNTVVYGHNMKDGSMFASLAEYKDQKYYESFPIMILHTPDGDFKIELFAGIVADGNYEFVRFEFQDDGDFTDYINTLKAKSTFESNTIIRPDDRIITLCTCSHEFNNARYALFGKLIPN